MLQSVGARSRGIQRVLLGRLASSGSILCFHGVSAPETSSASTANLSLESILGLLSALDAAAELVPLRTIVDRHAAGKTTAGLAAVTFDDAYASLRGELLAFVRRRQTPITLFATTAADLPRTGFWWDRVDEAFSRVPRARWRSFEEELGLPAAYRAGQPASFGPLRPLRQWVLSEFKGRCPPCLDSALQRLEAEIGHRTHQRPLSLAELTEIATDPLIDVAVHTVTHPVLPLLADHEVKSEIRDCHDALRERMPRALAVLAFPFGLFDDRTVRLAREAGMRMCVSLGDHTLAWSTRFPNGVVPRLSVSAGFSSWKLRLHLMGVIEQVNRILGRSQPAVPILPSTAS